MKKKGLTELVLVLFVLGVSFWNVKQQQETLSLREAISVLDEDKKELKLKEEELIKENDQLTKQVASLSKSLKEFQKQKNNSGADTDVNTEFINIVTKLFKTNLNFTPENYDDRKHEVSGYLSEELIKEYFGQSRNTYQDANDTISQLIYLEVYSKGIRENDIEGIVVAYHKSKRSNQNWINGMNIFKVTYDSDSKKVIKIINLGTGYSDTRMKKDLIK